MGRTDAVAHDPSDRVRRGHLPALRAGRNLDRRCVHTVGVQWGIHTVTVDPSLRLG